MREGPPFDPAAFGLARHTVYLSPHEVVFLFEAPDADVHLLGWIGLADESIRDEVRRVCREVAEPFAENLARLSAALQ